MPKHENRQKRSYRLLRMARAKAASACRESDYKKWIKRHSRIITHGQWGNNSNALG